MNKNELITLLRDPSGISSEHLDEIDDLLKDSPYFLSARLLLAKGSKELKDPKTKKRIASAAVYSTDRILLKKYISGDLFFLSQPPAKPKPKRKKVVTASKKAEPQSGQPRADKRPTALKPQEKKPSPKVPNVPTGDLDAILEELKQDMENLKSSRAHFVEVQHNIDEEESVSSIKESIQKEVEKDDIEEPTEVKVKPKEKASKESEKTEVEPKPVDIKSESAEEEIEKPEKKKVKKVISKETSSEEEDEIVNKKLAELAKKQEKKKEESKEGKETPKKKIEDKVALVKQEIQKKPDTKKEEPKADKDQGERAERSVKEPRFSRDATRSYLRKLDPPEDFPVFDDEDDDDPLRKPDSSDEPEKPEAKEQTTKQDTKVEEKEEPKTKSEELLAKEEKPTAPTQKEKPKSQDSKKSDSQKKDTPAKSNSGESAMPKATIVKKAKLVKSKRSSKKRGSSGEPKLPKSGDAKDDDGKGDRESQVQIIDKFIKESPSIKYSRESEETSAADLAQESTSWDTDLASEHLAEIYLNQGNKKRAIEIYETLCLKYPEKKPYFAVLISKIK